MVRLARAVARALDDALTPAGVRLLGATLLLVSTGQLLVNTLLHGTTIQLPWTEVVLAYPATLPLGDSAAAWLFAGLWVVASYLLVVFLRTLVRDGDDGIHPDDVLHEALPATLRVAVAGAAGGALVLAGLAFGIGPGVLLAAHLLFVPVFVAVEDAGLISAVVDSWQLAAAHRVRVLAFTAVVTVLLGAVGVAGALSASLDPWLEFLLGVAATVVVLSVAVPAVVDVYRQHGENAGPPSGTGQRRGAGAL
ncbi:MAG: hypothetical protein ABEJ34_02665 [Haloferacaceae archaeon]